MKGANQSRGTGIRRLLALGSGGGLAALAVVMLLAPVTLGSVQVAPFKGWAVQNSVSLSQSGCAKAKMLKFPNFSPKTGIGHFSGSAKAPVCKPSASLNTAYFVPSISLSKNMVFSKNKTVTIQLNWSITEAAIWTATPYSSCALNYKASFSTCYTAAEAEIFGFVYMYDQNNFSNFYFGSSWFTSNFTYTENYSQNYCYGGTCYHYGGNFTGGSSGSFSGTILENSTVSGAVVKGDTFSVYSYMAAFVFASAYTENAVGSGSASAAASMNVASLGNQVALTAIWIH